jgi:TolA-binding protein
MRTPRDFLFCFVILCLGFGLVALPTHPALAANSKGKVPQQQLEQVLEQLQLTPELLQQTREQLRQQQQMPEQTGEQLALLQQALELLEQLEQALEQQQSQTRRGAGGLFESH